MILEKALLLFILPIFLFPNGLLEEEMVTHSNILAWRIPMDRGAWWATAHGITESDMTKHIAHTKYSIYAV